jgi:hypothetical protein
MKNISKILLVIVMLFTFSAVNFAQTVQSTTASAVIIEPITIVKNSDLNFGTIMRGAANSTVAVSTAGARTVTGGDVTLSSLAPVAAAASFTIDGSDGAAYTITVPSGAINIAFGINTMSVDTWVTNPAGLTGNFPSPGTVSLLIGATLHVGAAQVSGSYSGTFNVSVDYN